MIPKINKEALIRGVQRCVSQWLVGLESVTQDAQTLFAAYSTFETENEHVNKLFFFLHETARLDAVRGFESELVYKKMVLPEVPDKIFGNFHFPPKDVLADCFKNWIVNRLKTIQETIDENKMLMKNWLIFDLHNEYILKSLAKVFSSGSIFTVVEFEERNVRPLRFQMLDIELNSQVSPNKEVPSQTVESDHEKESKEMVNRLFAVFLRRMAKKNDRLKKYFQFDEDSVRESNEFMEKAVSSKFSAADAIPDVSGLSLSVTKQSEASYVMRPIDPIRTQAAVEFSQNFGNPITDSPNLNKGPNNTMRATDSANKEAICNLTRRESPEKRKERKLRERVQTFQKLRDNIHKVPEACFKNFDKRGADRLEKKSELSNISNIKEDISSLNSALSKQSNEVLNEYQALFESYRSQASTLSPEMTESLAKRYVELRHNKLNKMTNEELNGNEKLKASRIYYRLMHNIGVANLNLFCKLQLCLLHSLRLRENYLDLELAFFSMKDFRRAVVFNYDAKKQNLSDYTAFPILNQFGRETYQAYFAFYLERFNEQDYENTVIMAVEYMQQRIETLKKDVENDESNNAAKEKLATYQQLLETDPLEIAETTMMEMKMMLLETTNPSFLLFETVFFENLKKTAQVEA